MFIICNNCKLGLRITDAQEEIQSMLVGRDHIPCPECQCPCTTAPFVDNAVLQEKRVRSVTAMEAFLAIEGQGFPEERECAAEIVEKVLLEQRIKEVKVHSVPNTGRSVIELLTLEDGTVIYFGSSVHGALVYRIRRPHSYVKAVENNG